LFFFVDASDHLYSQFLLAHGIPALDPALQTMVFDVGTL
jgi:hypothetical protein